MRDTAIARHNNITQRRTYVHMHTIRVKFKKNASHCMCKVFAGASGIVASPLHLVEGVQLEVPFLHVPANPLHLCLQLLTDQLQLLALPTLSQQLLHRKGVNRRTILFGRSST